MAQVGAKLVWFSPVGLSPSALLLIADPDQLLTSEEAQAALKEQNFEVLFYADPLTFRLLYETQYRARLERGQDLRLVVVVATDFSNLKTTLPYDLWQRAALRLNYSLAELFPQLSYQLVTQLDRELLPDLMQAYQQNPPPQPLTRTATLAFLLEHLFKIRLNLITNQPELLKLLLQRHYKGQQLPAELDNYILENISRRIDISGWPLATILTNRTAFFQFLQAQWPGFIERWLDEQGYTVEQEVKHYLAEAKASYQVASPVNLPFEDKDVKVYIDDLFAEGWLQPLKLPTLPAILAKNRVSESSWWLKLGLQEDLLARLTLFGHALTEKLADAIPFSHQSWLDLAYRWAEYLKLWYDAGEPAILKESFQTLQSNLETSFSAWVLKRYNNLYNVAASQPLMVHQIAPRMADYLARDYSHKVALVVMDGLALDQWLVLRNVLTEQLPTLQFQNEACFAWLPTLTSVSRQAIFAGKLPLYFASSLFTTNKEEALWKEFWQGRGLTKPQIYYQRSLGEADSLKDFEEQIGDTRLRVVGLVVDSVDKLIHGQELGRAYANRQMEAWARQGFMERLLQLLTAHGYSIYLTADHGNVEATGIGNLKAERALTDLRGERVRVYDRIELRQQARAQVPDTIEWNSVALPANYLPLFAPMHGAFVQAGKKLIGHGGISVEELIVPYIQIRS